MRRPGGLKFNTRNCRENIDTNGLAPHSEEGTGLFKIRRAQTQRGTEFSQGGKNRGRILWISLHQDVEVFGRAWLSVDRIATAWAPTIRYLTRWAFILATTIFTRSSPIFSVTFTAAPHLIGWCTGQPVQPEGP